MTIKDLHSIFIESDGVSTDTRSLKENQVFVALKGEQFDGNNYIQEALNKGCRFVICENEDFSSSEKVFVAKSALQILQDLALFHRKSKDVKVLAITGSNGKTTTKELVKEVLSRKFKVLATEGNLNNHIGVPLTVLKIKDHEIAVVEMGANHLGEIWELCNIAAPDAGIITNIGMAHLEGFGSIEGVEKAKGELFDYLAMYGGVAIVNKDDASLTRLADERKLQVFPFGAGHDLYGELTALDPKVTGFFVYKKKKYAITSELFGSYNINNILSAIAAGLCFEVDPTDAAKAVSSYSPGNNRSQVVTGNSNTLILDAYNANPTSMRCALDDFKKMKGTKKMVILGEMLEVGTQSEQEHKRILTYLKESEFQKVYLVGRMFKELANLAEEEFIFCDTVMDCVKSLELSLPEGYTILIKGSRKNALEKSVELLINC